MEEVKKGGNIVFAMTLGRSKVGQRLEIRASPDVVEWMRAQAEGDTAEVAGLDRYWTPVNKEHPLVCWMIPQQPIFAAGELTYTLNRPGAPLILDGGRREVDDFGRVVGGVVNISFLRLVGLTEGVTFDIHGPAITPDGLKDLAAKLRRCMRQFYADFLLPVELDIVISTTPR